MVQRRTKVILVVIGVVTAVVLPAGFAFAEDFLSSFYSTTAGVTYNATNGPEVNYSKDLTVQSGNPFTTKSVNLSTESNGHVNLSAPNGAGTTEPRVQVDEINGTWTNVSKLDVDNRDLTIDPSDKQSVTIVGSANTLKIQSMALDDGTVDFIISGPTGTQSDLTIRDLPSSQTITAINDSSGKPLDVVTTGAGGTATFTIKHSTQTVRLVSGDQSNAATQSNEDPTNNTKLSDKPTSLSIDINDSDFPEDNVTVQFFLDGSEISRQSITSNGTVTTSNFGSLAGGDHTYTVNTTDDFGNHNNRTYNFKVPQNLTIREEAPPHTKIDTAEVDIKFFEDQDTDPEIINRTVTDGKVDLSGLPVGSEFTVSISASGYHNRTIIIDSLFDQQTAFLLNKNRTSLETRFTVEDRTGEFPAKDSELVVQAAINRSLYDGTPPAYNWTNIAGDDLGADKAFVVDLEEEERYRIRVENNDNDTRILGAYTAETSGTVELQIGNVVADPQAPDTVGWAANRTNKTGEPVQINFEFNDSTDETGTLYLHIYEYQNESNELLANTSFNGPFGTFQNVEDVPSDENETEWVVEFVAVRNNDDNIRGREVIGPQQRGILPELPSWLRALVALGSIWLVAGLFSQVNGDIGALFTASLGGLWWYIDFLPGQTGVGVVVLSMVIGGLMVYRERRGGGL